MKFAAVHSFQLCLFPQIPPGTAIGITWRGFWTGIFLSFFLAIGAPYANMAMHSTFMAWDFNTPGAIFLFLVLIGLLNVLFKVVARNGIWALGVVVVALGLYLAYYLPQPQIDLFKPGLWFASFLVASVLLNAALVWHGRSLALDRADLVLVYIMLLMVSALCTMGMSQQLLPILASFAYYGTPQNQWQEKLGPLLPERAILVDDGADNRAFFEGGEIPYGAWVEPLLWWAVFLIALYATMVAAAVILRRQWMDRERLAYPVAQVGAAMVQGEGRGLVNLSGLSGRRCVTGAGVGWPMGGTRTPEAGVPQGVLGCARHRRWRRDRPVSRCGLRFDSWRGDDGGVVVAAGGAIMGGGGVYRVGVVDLYWD